MSRLNPPQMVERVLAEMRDLYLQDLNQSQKRPWVVGFSGGKDSSAVVQLVFKMLLDLPQEQRHKTVHVIASDTLVETPVVEEFLDKMIHSMRDGAQRLDLPVVVQKVIPDISDTFWVNLLGKGYPSPNRFFRWCTERLKINPATRYIQQEIDKWGQVIILLGARKEESSTRAQVLEHHRLEGSVLRRHATMPNAFVYTPIADWSAEDVWSYLLAYPTPWDPRSSLNSVLRDLYRDANSGECPLVLDTSTPACGQSRFGCWTCTVVTTDTSMEGFLEVGGRYQWMAPLHAFRNKLKQYRDDPSKRERWRRSDPDRPRGWAVEMGQLHLPDEEEPLTAADELGPFKLEVRQELLKELLQIQKETGYRLIQEQELELIRRHWTEDYRVSPLAMLEILEEVYGSTDRAEQRRAERRLLEQVCAETEVDVLAVDRLIDVERGYLTKLRRRGLLKAIAAVIEDLVRREASISANSQSVSF